MLGIVLAEDQEDDEEVKIGAVVQADGCTDK